MQRDAIAVGLAGLAGWTGSGCHVLVHSELSQPVASERVQRFERPVARRPAVAWTTTGYLRFVEPLDCPTEELTQQRTTLEVQTQPNLATFTVGLLVAAAGGVMLTSGLFAASPGSSPYTYLGGGAVVVGLPLAIGPWIGNGVAASPRTGDEDATHPVRHMVPNQPCGERPLAAHAATLAVSGLEVHGAIDRDGVFAVSPYQWIDAYAARSAVAAALTATVDTDRGARKIEGVLAAEALGSHAAGYLASADFDARIEPLRVVPGISAGRIQASLRPTDDGAAVRVVLPLRNDGPGDAWAVRGQIMAPAAPAIDGRMIYVGRLARGAAVTRTVTIAVSPGAVAGLRKPLELSIELRDAHGTAPTTPVRFRGVLTDTTR